jgi:hypothetical protein
VCPGRISGGGTVDSMMLDEPGNMKRISRLSRMTRKKTQPM